MSNNKLRDVGVMCSLFLIGHMYYSGSLVYGKASTMICASRWPIPIGCLFTHANDHGKNRITKTYDILFLHPYRATITLNTNIVISYCGNK